MRIDVQIFDSIRKSVHYRCVNMLQSIITLYVSTVFMFVETNKTKTNKKTDGIIEKAEFCVRHLGGLEP